ncbi:hypothetical protein K504DRAFT_449845 [Pleomassaria siparia CBS 279.74]|uniref:Glycosyltransferase family 1 protein n=1 Tax=Pleomassaria siparia CBS 279.74 TaxID=1314801 RepID=A0A6G1KJT0_9PLEO|nr:hypothetical protein K504DRAFT_449845 [Pleomassaria siparia CBS 279.74]
MRVQISDYTPDPSTPGLMSPRSEISEDEGRDGRGSETWSLVNVEPDTVSNTDLYSNVMTPPAYIQPVASTEHTIDAQAHEQENTGVSGNPSPYRDFPDPPDPSDSSDSPDSTDSPRTLRASSPSPSPSLQGGPSGTQSPSSFTKIGQDAALAYVRRCSVLPTRPAVWLVKRKNFVLSSLAAAVLCREGLVRSKDLVLISQYSGIKRDATDPLSAVAFATYDTVGEIMNGVIAGPMEGYRQVAPMLAMHEERQHNVGNSNFQASTPPTQYQSLSDRPGTPSADQIPSSPLHLYSDNYATFDAEHQPTPTHHDSDTSEDTTNAAISVAVGTGKGLGRIVGAGLKAPMTFTHGLTRGFHNMPKLYGEEVRDYENITDIRSGLSVSAKGLALGITDGLTDFFTKPIQGAQAGGVLGFAKGFGKGIGNLVCKPSAGAIGLVGYSFVGVYKEIQGINFSGKDSAGDLARWQGEEEYEGASKEVKLEVVNRWCQIMMRQNA